MWKMFKQFAVVGFVALALAPLAACKKAEGQACNHNADCKDDMVCVDAPGPETTCLEAAKATVACAASHSCKTRGGCAPDSLEGKGPVVCVAKTAAHCKASEGCKTSGACTYAEGNRCVK